MNNIKEKEESKGLDDIESKGFGRIIAPFTKGKHAQQIRIWRPSEFKAMVRAIPKDYAITQFEALLYSGCRYIELVALKDNPNMFEDTKIHLTPMVIKKDKIAIKERWVTLNHNGVRAIEDYLKLKKSLPHYNVWRENLERWADLANLPFGYRTIKHKNGKTESIKTHFMSAKTSRHTWESWLATYYPKKLNQIYLSQGHDSMTALNHYINLPFNQKDKDEMGEFVYGWEP